MALNGSGVYLVNSTGQPVVANTLISAAVFNSFTADIAAALSTAIMKDGQQTVTANIPLGGYKLTGLGDATTAGDAVRLNGALGTPSSLVLTNATGTPASIGLANATGTPASIGLANGTGLPAAGVTGTAVTGATLQGQTYTAFTTGGTSTAFTLTPTPAITANAANQRFRVKFNAASGATPTLAVSGQTALLLKYRDSTGAKQAITSTQVPINWTSDVVNDGTDFVVLEVPVVAVITPDQIQPISASVASSALTISASSLSLGFRSTTLGSGAVTTVTGTPANLVISSGSTLGTVSAVQSRIVVLAINNAGTIELAAVNIAGGNDLSETGVISTTAEGGAGAADIANVIYSTTARSSLSYRVIGYIESTQATAGTWATAPSTIQGAGGNALTAMSSLGYGQTWQNVLGSRSGAVTYYNTTGKPILVSISHYGAANIAVSGVVAAAWFNTQQNNITVVVPPAGSYILSTGTTLVAWAELR